jgi:ankyrin repeat protein
LLQDPSYAVVVSVPNALGQLPLHMAAMGGHRDVMLLLLHHAHTHANLAKTTLLATADQKGEDTATAQHTRP